MPAATKPEIEKPAPAAAQTPAEKPSKEPSKEDLAGIEQFAASLMGTSRYAGAKQGEEKEKTAPHGGKIEPKEEAGKPKDEKGKKDEKPAPAKPAEAARDNKGKFKPRGKAPEGEIAPLTAEQIAEAVAKGVTQATAAAKPPEKEKADPAADLSPKEKKKVSVLERMEKLYPDQYKDLPKRYIEANRKLEAYVAEWQKAHPGEEFSEDSPEHEAFFNANNIEWEDDDYTEALADIRADLRSGESRKDIDARLDELTRSEQRRKMQHLINAEQATAARQLWRTMGDDFEDIVGPDGNVNMAKLEEMKAADPEGYAIRIQAGMALDAEVEAMYGLLNGLEKFSDSNAVHKNVNQFALVKEQELLRAPKQDQLDEQGREFLPANKYYEIRPRAVREQKYWTFSVQDMALLRAKDLAAIVNRRVQHIEESHRRWAQSKGLELEKPDAKPRSPSLGGGGGAQESRMAAEAAAAGQPAANEGNGFANKFLGA